MKILNFLDEILAITEYSTICEECKNVFYIEKKIEKNGVCPDCGHKHTKNIGRYRTDLI